MKRSEALKIINDAYEKFVEDWLDLDINNSEKIEKFIPLNERILNALEKSGMLPPFTHLKSIGVLDTAWEPEDE